MGWYGKTRFRSGVHSGWPGRQPVTVALRWRSGLDSEWWSNPSRVSGCQPLYPGLVLLNISRCERIRDEVCILKTMLILVKSEYIFGWINIFMFCVHLSQNCDSNVHILTVNYGFRALSLINIEVCTLFTELHTVHTVHTISVHTKYTLCTLCILCTLCTLDIS